VGAIVSRPAAAPPYVQLSDIGKHFGGVSALRGVSLELRRGEVHALVGENGAGKSTLGKILAGVHTPDAGEMRVDGRPVVFHGTNEALGHGFTTIAQELPLVPALSVIDNVFLGVPPTRFSVIDRAEQRRRFAALCDRTGFELPAGAKVLDLRVADRQKVAIMAALAKRAELIVMDEPTAALPAEDTAHLLQVIRTLAGEGTTIVYVSHYLEEVLAVADTVTVMKDGVRVRTAPAESETPASLVAGMLGRAQDQQYPPKEGSDVGPSPDGLEVRALGRRGAFEDVSFTVCPGEIVGLAGLVGSGRTEIARAIFGADRYDSGEVLVGGRAIHPRHPADAIDLGVALVPDDRKQLGLIMAQSLGSNLTLPSLQRLSTAGIMKRSDVRRSIARAVTQLGIKGAGRQAVATLSGGNQQKALFGRWMERTLRVLIVDEPTRGVDIGAKRALYDLLAEYARSGVAVLVISNENDELVGLCHRILVMRRGSLVADLSGRHLNEQEILRAAFGGSDVPPTPQELTS
jgi:rhamnose transport system ATP-binding protein